MGLVYANRTEAVVHSRAWTGLIDSTCGLAAGAPPQQRGTLVRKESAEGCMHAWNLFYA